MRLCDHAGVAWVAMLRGINVGGARRMPMLALRELHAELGHERVQTYVQSGNVVFSTPRSARPAQLAQEIQAAIAERFGLDDVDVVIRRGDELRRVVAENPFIAAGRDPAHLHVTFLAQAISQVTIASLDASQHAPEEIAPTATEIYLYAPNGLGRSALTKVVDERRLGTRSTTRNWRTVHALLRLVEGQQGAE